MKKILRYLAVKAMILKGRYDIRCMNKNANNARAVNDKVLMEILRTNRNCEYGKKYGFADIHSVEEFRKKVPIITYEDIRPQVERMYYKNESGLITSRKIIGYATSSGSIGTPKLIPRTNKDIRIYTKYTVTRFLALADQYLRKNGLHRLKPARGTCLLTRYDVLSPFGLPSTNVADIAAKKYFFIYPYILVLPLGKQFAGEEIDIKYACARFGLEDKDCSFLFYVFSKGVAEYVEYIRDNWQLLVEDIERGTISPTVRVREDIRAQLQKQMKPDPERAAELRTEFEIGFDRTIISRVWPNLSVISAIGTSASFEGFTETIKSYTDGVPFDYSIYGASEGLIAAAYEVNNPGQLLLTDSCYYEFFDPEDESGTILSLDELEVGKNYEILVTNRSGFYRYRLKDIIHVMGYHGTCPIVNFVYRTGQLLNVTGEKTTMEQMNEVIKRFETLVGTKIKEWAVFVDKSESQYRYGILTETADSRDLSSFTEEFEQLLRDVNTSYRFYEGNNLIDPPVILNQRPGTHEEWRQMKIAAHASPDQVKPVRILDTAEKREFFLGRTC